MSQFRQATIPATTLCLLFFLSGASALIFEALWFYESTLIFGNTVWASSLVLASFMAGLALGNGLAAKFHHRLGHPIRLYAILETIIALTGVGLVLLLAELPAAFAPIFESLRQWPVFSNLVRMGSAFALMVIPSTAMGMTLPILTRALVRAEPVFGVALGRLYSWNTSGAVVGVLLAEVTLIRYLGVVGAAAVAAGLNLIVAVAAWSLLAGHRAAPDPEPVEPTRLRGARLLLSVAFLTGALLLALEVVWFRFLVLLVNGTYLAFALMLATVLAGIGMGALVASKWCKYRPGAERHLELVLFLAGACVVGSFYFLTPESVHQVRELKLGNGSTLWHSLVLMFPVSCLSGIAFTLIGARLNHEVTGVTKTTGLLTLANTLGSLVGALLGGFLLLPLLGVELSFFVLALGYGVAGALAGTKTTKRSKLLLVPGVAVYALAMVGFPFGSFQRHMDAQVDHVTSREGVVTVTQKEGLSETITLIRKDIYDRPVWYKLVTNGHAMSATFPPARRYMKQYVYWPIAVHGEVRTALLISYGLGVTAKALVNSSGLNRIVIVDPSRDIVSMSRHVFSDETQNPTRDPRVELVFEDGQHFLHTSRERFDLITGEPPPPGQAGIVSLYTREYFALTRERLNKRGVFTYWLPVAQMRLASARAIIGAFCDVYEDCSLWAGSVLDFMLVGSNGLSQSVSQTGFERQWNDPVVLPDLRGTGFETPGQLAATFIADADQLKVMIGDVPPVTDNFPRRLDPTHGDGSATATYGVWLDTAGTERRFKASDWIARVLPESVRESSQSYFDYQTILNHQLRVEGEGTARLLAGVLENTTLETPVHWLLGSNQQRQENLELALADGYRPEYAYELAVRALGARDYQQAYRYLADIEGPDTFRVAVMKTLCLCHLDRATEAGGFAESYRRRTGRRLGVGCM